MKTLKQLFELYIVDETGKNTAIGGWGGGSKVCCLCEKGVRKTQNENGSSGDGDAMGTPDSWSNGVLDIVAMLGEGASSMVEVVWDKWTGRWFAEQDDHHAQGPAEAAHA
ncbi:hypothetical protein F5148DRAFT_1149591 [Russula earlei]|uniref:Uncharacterized protein n=1 Tax=Russula earlei TaxID=71964 RepID=A0ACC0U7K9_9AGAM|nr:hypothetical protein F5148DRAFT_1149591 [Russula earlei]